MSTMVQTVTGPVPVERLGRALMHEHLFISFAGAEFDSAVPRFDRPAFVEEAVRRLVELRTVHGVRTFVDPCPIELGRDVEVMREISEKSGMYVICTTGFYYEAMGLPPYWRQRTVDEIAELYVRELTHGIGDTGVKAGAIKVATGGEFATEQEKKFLAAACIAQRATGVPIITHTQDGIGGPEQQRLFAEGGVAPHRCLIGHCCGSADPAYHRRVVDGGSYIGFDRIGLARYQPDNVRANNLAKLVKDGFRSQIMMSMDRWCGWNGKLARQITPAEAADIEAQTKAGTYPPHYTYLFTDFLPMLHARGVNQADIAYILEENPRRFFAGEVLPEKT